MIRQCEIAAKYFEPAVDNLCRCKKCKAFISDVNTNKVNHVKKKHPEYLDEMTEEKTEGMR
jgi:hypothetical protein